MMILTRTGINEFRSYDLENAKVLFSVNTDQNEGWNLTIISCNMESTARIDTEIGHYDRSKIELQMKAGAIDLTDYPEVRVSYP